MYVTCSCSWLDIDPLRYGAVAGITLRRGDYETTFRPDLAMLCTSLRHAGDEFVGLPRTLVYPHTTLGRLLDQTADRFGPATAMVYNHRTWIWEELRQQVNRMAGGLASVGVRRGERVVMTLPNCPEYVVAFFASAPTGLPHNDPPSART